MATLVAQMTKDELVKIIETTIEQKFINLFGDLDEEVEIKQVVRDRLLRQKQMVAQGERVLFLANNCPIQSKFALENRFVKCVAPVSACG
ncbi:MAG: hypothetical protein B6243_09515 [Anaerolineaceae bacterium 4572_5.2]|nr:MAG: hypothetical protein B6243_09515 [Anaerolineaceae bacterium 4572_5.2]